MNKALLFGLLIACGGTTTPNDAGPDVTGDSPPTTTFATFAMKRIYLGDADRNGTPSTTAWKSYGMNIDGLVTTSTSIDGCTLPAGAPKANQVDGNNGVDNAWGAILLPIFQTAASVLTPSKDATTAIDQGETTLLVRVSGLTDDPAQTATGLKARVVAGGTYTGTPAFDATTSWPTLSGATPIDFDANITNGSFITSPGAPLVVTVPIGGFVLTLTIHEPVIGFTHPDHANVTNGVIAGVLDTNELVAAFDSISGEISASLCGAAKDGIVQQFRQASEILVDGTNTAGTPCTGISIGLGFDAVLIGDPAAPAAITSPPNPCP